jgi:hypothetical protein
MSCASTTGSAAPRLDRLGPEGRQDPRRRLPHPAHRPELDARRIDPHPTRTSVPQPALPRLLARLPASGPGLGQVVAPDGAARPVRSGLRPCRYSRTRARTWAGTAPSTSIAALASLAGTASSSPRSRPRTRRSTGRSGASGSETAPSPSRRRPSPGSRPAFAASLARSRLELPDTPSSAAPASGPGR